MTDVFFKNSVYFQTSFLLPNSTTVAELQSAVNALLKKRFRVFLSLVDVEHGTLKENTVSKTIPVKELSAVTIGEIHDEVCRDSRTRMEMACRLFLAVDGDSCHYLIVHAHHGVADGTLITAFVRCLYAVMNHNPLPDMPDFEFFDPTKRPELLEFPDSVDSSDKDSVQKWCEDCAQTISPATVYPEMAPGSHFRYFTKERIISKEVTKRAVTFAKSCGDLYKENGCIHGMLLRAYLRAIVFADHLPQSGIIGIDTIVNMRRYLKAKSGLSLGFSSIDDTQPSIFFSSFPSVFSVEKLLQGELNPARIQHTVTEGLNQGLPLALLFLDPSRAHPSIKKNQLVLEMSNLGIHPKDCFPRRLVSQVAYDGRPNTITVVVWTDLTGCFHLCCSAFSGYVEEDRLDRFMDEFAHQLFDCGVVSHVCSTRHFTFLLAQPDSMSKESVRLAVAIFIVRTSPFRMSGSFAFRWMTTMKRTRA